MMNKSKKRIKNTIIIDRRLIREIEGLVIYLKYISLKFCLRYKTKVLLRYIFTAKI